LSLLPALLSRGLRLLLDLAGLDLCLLCDLVGLGFRLLGDVFRRDLHGFFGVVHLVLDRCHGGLDHVFLVSGRGFGKWQRAQRSSAAGTNASILQRMRSMDRARVVGANQRRRLGLVSRLSYGVDKYVDHLTAGLRADAIEYRVQASDSVRIRVADDGLGRGGDGQLDASMIL
jgi:hypothetical protein